MAARDQIRNPRDKSHRGKKKGERRQEMTG